MKRKAYDTDLTDKEWAKLEPYCQWRMLPHDFSPYPTVWSFFRRAKESGLWDTILAELVKK
ncbi:transposase, partial [Streptococcus ruminantium]|nr:transposase [Streptococcus ruminantium]